MKRLFSIALIVSSVLGLGSSALATQVVFNLAGVVGLWTRSTDANAAIPGPPTYGGTCAPGLGSSTPPPEGPGDQCFRYVFGPGSSLTVDIVGNAVTLSGGTLKINATTPLVFGTINLTKDLTFTVEGGATGTISGDTIHWATSSAYSNATGTLTCNGVNCSLLSMPEGEALPYDDLNSNPPLVYSALSDTRTALPAEHRLGRWDLDPTHTSIVASTNAVTRFSNHSWPNPADQDAEVLTFGPTLLGDPPPPPPVPILPMSSAVALNALLIAVVAARISRRRDLAKHL